MEVEDAGTDLIHRSLEATEKAIICIRDGDSMRRDATLELRNLQLSLHEDFERMRVLMSEFDAQLRHGSIEGSKWLDRKIEKAKAAADQALSSVLMVKDVQMLEKKVEILKESVIAVNKAYYNYEREVDMKDLMDQVSKMVYRTEKKEKEVLGGKMADEETIERAFRGAIEGLYGLKSTNPKLMEEAKKLALELRVFRDAASNKNFYTMISKSNSGPQHQSPAAPSSASASSESTFSSASSSATPSTNTSSTSASSTQ